MIIIIIICASYIEQTTKNIKVSPPLLFRLSSEKKTTQWGYTHYNIAITLGTQSVCFLLQPSGVTHCNIAITLGAQSVCFLNA